MTNKHQTNIAGEWRVGDKVVNKQLTHEKGLFSRLHKHIRTRTGSREGNMSRIMLCILCLSLALLAFGKIAKYIAHKRKVFYEKQLSDLKITRKERVI